MNGLTPYRTSDYTQALSDAADHAVRSVAPSTPRSGRWSGLTDNPVRLGATVFLLLVALVFGGSSRPPLALLVELASLPLVAVLLLRRGPLGAGRAFVVLAAVAAALVVAQLVPLPAAFVARLPGQAQAEAIRQLAGVGSGWRPVSLDPESTLASLMACLPGFAMFAGALRANERERTALVAIAASVAAVSALLGLMQVASLSFYPYETAHRGNSVGLFANRNHHADLILSGAILVSALGARVHVHRVKRLVIGACIAVLALTTVATTSRMGIVLTLPTLLVCAVVLYGLPVRLAVPILVAIGLGGAALSALPAMQPVLARFAEAGSDGRVDIWRDTWFAIHSYWPVGSGYGSFVPVYAGVEDLDRVDALYVVHAHNDYLELLLEGGLAAAALMVAFMALFLRAALRLPRDAPEAVAGFGIVVLILLHSIVDYPLRTFALSTVFGLGLAMMLVGRTGEAVSKPDHLS